MTTAFQPSAFQFSGFQEAAASGSGDVPWYVKYEFGRLARRFAERKAEAERLEEERKEREREELVVPLVTFVPASEPVITEVVAAAVPETTVMRVRTKAPPDRELEAFHAFALELEAA